MVPNQPLIFSDSMQPLVEDGFIAYTWDKYLRTGEADWLARLPMTKSAVRAMDTVTAFIASAPGGNLKVDRFVVAGGSKEAGLPGRRQRLTAAWSGSCRWLLTC